MDFEVSKGSWCLRILYEHMSQSEEDAILGYCDSDYATNLDTRRSQTGYVLTLYGSAICWKSGLQNVVALSTAEAKYMALKGLAVEFCLAKHQIFHERCKHIDVRLYFIRDDLTC